MAIVKMKKLILIGLNNEKESLLNDLMWLSAVDISPLTEDSLEEIVGLVKNDGAVLDDERYVEEIGLLNSAMTLMGMNYTLKKPMFSAKDKVYRDDFGDELFKTQVLDFSQRALDIQSEINNLKTVENRLKQTLVSLKPWQSLPTPFASLSL